MAAGQSAGDGGPLPGAGLLAPPLRPLRVLHALLVSRTSGSERFCLRILGDTYPANRVDFLPGGPNCSSYTSMVTYWYTELGFLLRLYAPFEFSMLYW